jgi:subtilisin-like proprotein convertase family protein
VRGLDSAGETVFEATANLFGDFEVEDDVVCGPYTITVDLFGYLHWEQPHFIDYGPNSLDVVMEVAPNGVLSGTVTEAGTSLPLLATVSVYRNDTMALYDETSSDPGTGEYATGQLPYFDYTVIASAPQHAPDTTVVTINAPGIEMNFELERVYVEEVCRTPYLSIPDNDPAGVSDSMSFEMSAIIEEVEVYVDIDHTYQGDLVVRLTSPEGTEVTLHNRTGGSTDDIHGWYPDELIPAESLDAFVGENCQGTWTLSVSDEASYDVGTLREWCLRITYSDEAVGVAGAAAPTPLRLGANVPNPFNPATRIAFDLPQPGPVRLMVFDVRGAAVATLVEGRLGAGRHTAVWTGRDAGGRPVGSGIYFYRLEAQGTTLTRRMVLVK